MNIILGKKEYELKAKLNGLTLIGYADHYCPNSKVLNENNCEAIILTRLEYH